MGVVFVANFGNWRKEMKNNTKKLTFIALAVAINIAGSKLALLLHLPIFLDSIGTMFAAVVLGPLGGAAAALVGGLINGVLGDVYAIYFSLSGVLMGLIAGFIFHGKEEHPTRSLLWKTILVTLPASALSACIETFLFGGITSALTTTFIIQALSQTALRLFGSAFLIQALTDYADKLIALFLVMVCMGNLPYELTHFEDDQKKNRDAA